MTVIPAKHTFTIWQGATFYEALTLYETMDQTQPRNLTGFTATMIIRDKPNSDNIYLTLASPGALAPDGTTIVTSNQGCSITLQEGNVTGLIKLRIDAKNTELGPKSANKIDWKSAVYDLTLRETSTGKTDALLYGGIKVNGV